MLTIDNHFRKIGIVGCGNSAVRLAYQLERLGGRPDYLFDNYKDGSMFGIDIEPIDAVQDKKNVLLLISSENYYRDLRRQLMLCGKREFRDFIKGGSLGKKKVFIHGNCTCVPIAKLLSTSVDFNKEYYIYEISEVWKKDNTWERIIGITQNCDVIIHQNIGDANLYDYRFADNYLKRYLKDNCKDIIFPHLTGMGEMIFPQSYRRANDCNFQYGDKHIDAFAAEVGIDEQAIAEFFCQNEIYSERKVIEIFADVIRRFREKEIRWDIKVVDYILETYKQKQPFYDLYHPTDHILIYIARQILNILGIGARASDVSASTMNRYFDRYEMPIYPEVKHWLGIEWQQEIIRKNSSALFSKMNNRREWIQEYAFWIRNC